MPTNISKEEIKLLANPRDGSIPNWDSDREADDFAPPAKVQAYCKERDEAYELEQKKKREQQCKEFNENEDLKQKIWAQGRKAKRDQHTAAKAKRDKAKRDAFNLMYAKERREKELSSRALRLSDDNALEEQATSTTPDCPPVKNQNLNLPPPRSILLRKIP